MKFQRLPCHCCKTSAERLQCKSPTYVLSEVVDDSNVIFLLMSKRGLTSCGGPLAIDQGPSDRETPEEAREQAFADEERHASGRRAEAIVESRLPSRRSPANDDFVRPRQSPLRRNRLLLEQASGFWPQRARIQDGDGAPRERD